MPGAGRAGASWVVQVLVHVVRVLVHVVQVQVLLWVQVLVVWVQVLVFVGAVAGVVRVQVQVCRCMCWWCGCGSDPLIRLGLKFGWPMLDKILVF